MECAVESEGMHYEGNCIRPPSEAFSILLQVTVGCSHNKCTFCGTYKDERFRIKDDGIILSDILFASKVMKRQDRVFLMDGDALIIPQKRLMRILDRIKEHLPWVRRVGAYANAKSVKMKTPSELAELKQNGLGILYYGVESGDEEVLRMVTRYGPEFVVLEEGGYFSELEAVRRLLQLVEQHPDQFRLEKSFEIDTNWSVFEGAKLLVYRNLTQAEEPDSLLELTMPELRESIGTELPGAQ